MQNSIKIGEETYEKLQKVKKISGVPLTKLIDFAWDEFEKTDKFKNIQGIGKLKIVSRRK